MDLLDALLTIKVKIDFGKPFEKANFFISFMCSGSKFTLETRLTFVTRL